MALSDHPMWRSPQHHQDIDNPSDHVHWIELFYDLIHVVAVFLLGNFLSYHINGEGIALFCGLFVAIWFAWADSSVYNSLYVSTDVKHRFIMSIQICTVMFMTASIMSIPGKGWTYFALSYAANRAITAYMYRRAVKVNQECHSFSYEISRNFFILSIIFAVSAFLPSPWNYVLFFSGIITIQLLYMLPKIGVLRLERFIPRLGHMAERFALLLLIVLGEGFFKLVVTLAEKGIYKVPFPVLVNFIFGGISIFILCWIYFGPVGNGKPKDTEKRTLVQWWLSHMLLMLSAIMIGVAMTGEVKVGFWDPYPFKYALLGCIGLALYLFCLLLIQMTVEKRVAHDFITLKLRFFGIFLALTLLTFVNYIPALIGNIIWATALFSQILVPLTQAYLKFKDD